MADQHRLEFMVAPGTFLLFKDFADYSGVRPSGLARTLAEQQQGLVSVTEPEGFASLENAVNSQLPDTPGDRTNSLIQTGRLGVTTLEIYDQASQRLIVSRRSVARTAILFGLIQQMEAERFSF